MGEISKDFDGISWEWRGKTLIGLKPICPNCKYELDIIKPERNEIKTVTNDDGISITVIIPDVSYSCPKCSFSIETTIDCVKSPKDLRKAVRKEFEHRQRLMAIKKNKNYKSRQSGGNC